MINKQELDQLFDNFNDVNVLIIGDVMVDQYLIGKANRISPEAPVPVIDITKKEARPGGAANVAINIKALGATPILFAIAGEDDAQRTLQSILAENDISSDHIFTTPDRPTTVKTRVISNKQQVVRFDEEQKHAISSDLTNQLIDEIQRYILNNEVDVILFEDYDKGLITSKLIRSIVNLANQRGIPTVVDPKKVNFLNYKEVSLFKPNLRELAEGLNISIAADNKQEVIEAVHHAKDLLEFKSALITLSEFGIYYYNGKEDIFINAHLRNISDVSGAGDTVVSVAALCMALKAKPQILAEITNISGGLVCEKPGVSPINLDELRKESYNLLIS